MIKRRSPQTAHELFWEHNNNPDIYTYDPTDDGPECFIIKGIQASHSEFDLGEERADFQYTAWVIGRIVMMLRDQDPQTEIMRLTLDEARRSEFADRIRLRGVTL